MKIAYLCFLHPSKVPGGQQRIAYDLFQCAGSKYGFDNTLFIASDLQVEPLRTAQSSRLVEVGKSEFVYVCQRYDYRFHTNFDVKGQLEIIRLLKSLAPDVIHVHHFLAFGLDFFPALRAAMPNTRLVFTLHEFLPICQNNGHLLRKHDGGICDKVHAISCQKCFPNERLDYFEHRRAFVEDILSIFDGVSAVSNYARDILDKNLSLRCPVKVIENGPLKRDDPRGGARNANKKRRLVIGFIGQVHAVKGVDLLLGAVDDLMRETGGYAHSIEVHIFGNLVDLGYREVLERRVAQVNSTSLKVVLRGPYSATDLERVFSDIDLVVIPSIWPETYCLTVDEAVHAKKTVVCANFPAVLERIRECKGAFLFQSGSQSDLMRALGEAIKVVRVGEWENPFSKALITVDELFKNYHEKLYLS
ncbi:MAG: glycosyltransferase family 4 protein [Thiobacillus sp.]|nr:glycosyltransferase family 4 protein [Thiobacillus sp.]